MRELTKRRTGFAVPMALAVMAALALQGCGHRHHGSAAKGMAGGGSGWKCLIRVATIDQVRACVAEGADVAERGRLLGWTPLHMVAWQGPPDGVVALLDAGAEVDAAGKIGATPLHAAAMATPDNIRLLVWAGADVEARTETGETPLHVAAMFGTGETVDALLELGADINAANRAGATPLHAAAAVGVDGAVRRLIEAGADAGAAMDDGATPRDLALRFGRTRVAGILDEVEES